MSYFIIRSFKNGDRFGGGFYQVDFSDPSRNPPPSRDLNCVQYDTCGAVQIVQRAVRN